MSSSIKHVRLSFGEEGIVFPVAQKTGPVSQLLAAATVRFRALRLLAADDSFIEITSGGYKINPTDNIEDVIENGEALTLVNRTAWVAKFRSQYKIDYWCVSFASFGGLCELLLSNSSFSIFFDAISGSLSPHGTVRESTIGASYFSSYFKPNFLNLKKNFLNLRIFSPFFFSFFLRRNCIPKISF